MALRALFIGLLLGCSSAAGDSADSAEHGRVRRGALSGGDLVQAAAAEFESRARAAADRSVARLEERLDGLQKQLTEQTARLEEALSMLRSLSAALSEQRSNLQRSGPRPHPSDRPSPTVGRVLGQPCLVDADCSDLLADTACGERGRCECAAGLLRGPGETCQPAPWLNGECDIDQHCEVLTPHAVCSPERTCRCPDNMMTLRDECRPFPRLSERCQSDDDCRLATPSAVCSPLTRLCECPRGSWNLDNMRCRPGVPRGRPCLYDRDCSTLQNFTACIDGVCQVRRCDLHVGAVSRFRLAGGSSCRDGYIEFTYNSGKNWTFLCDSNWTVADATVFCGYMGFDWGEPRAVGGSGSSSNVTRFLWVQDLRCQGTESSPTVCVWNEGRTSCPISEVAAVECFPDRTEPPSTAPPPTELAANDDNDDTDTSDGDGVD